MNKRIYAILISLIMLANSFIFVPTVRADEFEDINFEFEISDNRASASDASSESINQADKGLTQILQGEAPYDVLISYDTEIANEDELQENASILQERTKLILEQGISDLKVDSYESFYIINAIRAIINDAEILEEIASLDEVKSIENNIEISLDPLPTNVSSSRKKRSILDESIVDMEDFSVFSQELAENVTWAVKNTKANKVWKEYALRGDGITIGIMDTGVNYKLDELKYAYKGYDESSDTFDDSYYRDFTGLNNPINSKNNWHGTMVATSIVGRKPRTNVWATDDEGQYHFYQKDMYYYGTAPNVKFINAKVLDGRSGKVSDFVGGGEWLLEQRPDIINNSWGNSKSVTNAADEIIQTMISNWQNAGILVVFASGNELKYSEARDGSIAYPANMRGVFAVGAISEADTIWAKSQRGKSPFTNDIKPDVVAPGELVRTLTYDDGTNISKEGSASGTSLAAPMTSGVMALVKEANPDLSANEIYDIIRKTARPLTDKKYTNSPNMAYGYGAVDAYRAVSLALGKIRWNEQTRSWEDVEESRQDSSDNIPAEPHEELPQEEPRQEVPAEPREEVPAEPGEEVPAENTGENVPAEEPSIEEPSIEEPSIEEPSIEEPRQQPSENRPTEEAVPVIKLPVVELPSVEESSQDNTNNINSSNSSNVSSSSTNSAKAAGGGGGGSSSRFATLSKKDTNTGTSNTSSNIFNTNKTLNSGKWELLSAKWYLLDGQNTKIKNAWANISGIWYALDGSGVMSTYWAKINNKWYYFNESGAMLSNTWIYDKGKWYYLGSDGAMLSSTWIKTSNKWYYLDASGSMLSATTMGSYKFDSTGALIE